MADADTRPGQAVHGNEVMRSLSKVFELSPAGLNWFAVEAVFGIRRFVDALLLTISNRR